MCTKGADANAFTSPVLFSLGVRVGGAGVSQKKLLLRPAAANNAAGSAYGKIGKERRPRCGAGTHVVKVNVRRG